MTTETTAEEAQDESSCFSRSIGLPAHMGKATADLKCKVPDVVKDDFVRLAHSLGLSESELLRSLVMVRLLGFDEASRMHADQLRLATGMGPVDAPLRGGPG